MYVLHLNCFPFVSFSFVSVFAFRSRFSFSLMLLIAQSNCCFGRKIRLHVNVIVVKKFYHHINKYGELITTVFLLCCTKILDLAQNQFHTHYPSRYPSSSGKALPYK